MAHSTALLFGGGTSAPPLYRLQQLVIRLPATRTEIQGSFTALCGGLAIH